LVSLDEFCEHSIRGGDGDQKERNFVKNDQKKREKERFKRMEAKYWRSWFESVTDYFSRTMAIVKKMRIHGDKAEDVSIVEKILRSLTPKFNFVVCSIEEANDVGELSIDELQSSFLVHEQKN
jgi:hypothetical protein